ncbi:MAG: helix-turn-helix domain-containing protein [Thermoanaerobaculia bacterium]
MSSRRTPSTSTARSPGAPALQPAASFESRAIDIPLPLSEMERLHIVRALDYTAGKKAPAARLLGIGVKTLSNKIKSYGIEV